jgi:predicted  nucleic acid-binding Zn-ribbon protein
MKKGFEKVLIPAVIISVVLMITAGCQEQKTTTQKTSVQAIDKTGKSVVIKTESRQTGDKAAKLTVAENAELKKQLARKDSQIGGLKKAIDKCEEEKDAVKKQLESDSNALGEELMKSFEETIKLQEENQNLKKEIEQLKAGNKN